MIFKILAKLVLKLRKPTYYPTNSTRAQCLVSTRFLALFWHLVCSAAHGDWSVFQSDVCLWKPVVAYECEFYIVSHNIKLAGKPKEFSFIGTLYACMNVPQNMCSCDQNMLGSAKLKLKVLWFLFTCTVLVLLFTCVLVLLQQFQFKL